MSLETAAPEASAPVSNEPLNQEGLAGLFKAELDAETPSNTVETQKAAPAEAAPDTEIDLDLGQPEPGIEVDAADAEQQDSPEADPGPAAIVAPSGMSEADKAVFDQLPPEAKAWIAKRESETRADYTRKTQAVAEQRKAVEAANAQVLTKLQQYDEVLSRFTTPVLTPPNPQLRMTDPVAYEDALAQYVHDKHLQDAAKDEQAKVRAEAEQAQTSHRQQFWAEQQQELAKLAPTLAANTPQAKATRRAVADYAMKQGYSQDQLEMASARDMVTLWKAHRYDAAMDAKSKAKPVVQAAPKVMAPGPAKAGVRTSALASSVRAFSDNPTRAALAEAYRAELASER